MYRDSNGFYHQDHAWESLICAQANAMLIVAKQEEQLEFEDVLIEADRRLKAMPESPEQLQREIHRLKHALTVSNNLARRLVEALEKTDPDLAEEYRRDHPKIFGRGAKDTRKSWMKY